MSGVRIGQPSVRCDRRVEHRRIPRGNRAAQHGLVGERERRRGAAVFRTHRKNRLKRCAQERRRWALARDVSERERKRVVRQVEVVEEVSADRLARQ